MLKLVTVNMAALVTLLAFQLMVTADHNTYYISEKATLEITLNSMVLRLLMQFLGQKLFMKEMVLFNNSLQRMQMRSKDKL